MAERILSAEFPPLTLRNDTSTQQFGQVLQAETDYLPYRGSLGKLTQYWINYSTIDLGGYTRQDDLTVFFRNAFPQTGGSSTVDWVATEDNPIDGFKAVYADFILVTSVPLNDDSLLANVIYHSGFIRNSSLNITLDIQDLDRTQIIFGRATTYGILTTSGSDSIFADGAGYTVPIQENDFSSLEPTAADTLYCYRLIALPNDGYGEESPNHLNAVGVPPKRVLLDISVNEEPFLSYMMRLQRSHRLQQDRELQ